MLTCRQRMGGWCALLLLLLLPLINLLILLQPATVKFSTSR